MDINIALLGLIEILSSISIGALILAVTYYILKLYGKNKFGIDDHWNLAYSIIIISILFSVGYMLSGVIQPIIDSFRLLSKTDKNTFNLIISFIAYGSTYIFIASLFSAIINYVGIKIYDTLTPLDEFEEIKNNNVSVALIMGVIIVVLTMMSKSGVILLIESFVPYPELIPS